MRIARTRWDGADPAAEAERLRSLAPPPREVDAEASAIVADVRDRGDAALRELTARLDARELEPGAVVLAVDPAEVERARSELDPALRGAIEVASSNIEAVARAELEAAGDAAVELAQGQSVGIRWAPVRAAGIYVPGGRAAYPSSALMGCVPARVAGVERIAVASPPGPDGAVRPEVLAACAVAGADEVYAVGGAQAVAALAYGTETVAPVDVVAGPGNRYVNAAKRLVFGEVGVDGIAGPSEVVVVLDGAANARWAALDLLAQAEHGADGLQVAIATDADAVDPLETALGELARERTSSAEAMLALVEAPGLGEALELSDAVAPEHLELMVEGASEQLAADRVAGCVFLGPGGAVAFGDYAAGSNHVLPTGGAARFSGPLGVETFRRRTGLVELGVEAAAALAPSVAALARAEGFDVHAESAEARGE